MSEFITDEVREHCEGCVVRPGCVCASSGSGSFVVSERESSMIEGSLYEMILSAACLSESEIVEGLVCLLEISCLRPSAIPPFHIQDKCYQTVGSSRMIHGWSSWDSTRERK